MKAIEETSPQSPSCPHPLLPSLKLKFLPQQKKKPSQDDPVVFVKGDWNPPRQDNTFRIKIPTNRGRNS
jgi:hypothetical protein